MSTFKPVITDSNSLENVDKVDGQLIAVYDSGELYIDKSIGNNVIRTKYSDVVVDTFNNIDSLVAPSTDKIYFATDTHQLLQATYNGANVTWTELGGGNSGMRWVSVPSAADASGTAGQVAYDSNYFYVCVATNTWKRAALSTWGASSSYSVSGTTLYTMSTDSISGTKLIITNGHGTISGTKLILD